MSDSFLDLYSVYKERMAAASADNDFYDYMHEAISTGTNNFSLFHRYFEKKIDLRWVDAIESCIIPLDNIIRNPRKFIVQEEEIVAIERARKITAESVRHLAQHTNLIARVEDDTVTPHHILNVFREESFEIYENRFIYTLVKQLEWFIQERYNVLFNLSDDENMNSLKMESSVKNGNELITFKMEIATQFAGDDTNSNGKDRSVFDRILRIKTVIDDFVHSSFMRSMRNCTPVRPPIMRTNVILKNPDFRACLALWQFIQSYDEVGYEITVKEADEMVSDEYRDDLYNVMADNYMLLKRNSSDKAEDYHGKLKKRKLKPKFLKRLAEELVLDYDMDEAEIRKVFIDEMKLASKRKTQGESKIKEAIARAIISENERKRIIEERIKAEIERKKEIERRRKEREAARIAKEKALEKARKEREKARLKAKKEKELALEKAAKEREKQRIAKQKEKERLAKEKAIALEKQRKAEQLAKEKAEKEKAIRLEKERIAKEKEKARKEKAKAEQLAKEKARKEKEKAKAKADAEKAAKLEKEKIAKAKEKERLAKQKAEALAKEKEKAEKLKAKEKEKAAAEKAAQLEKEKLAKEKAKEKARLAKEKADALAKEKALKEKEKAKAKAEAEKRARIEKEKLAKAKAKEKERLAIEKAKAQAKEKERIAKEKAKAKLEAEKQKAKEKEKSAKQKAKEKSTGKQ